MNEYEFEIKGGREIRDGKPIYPSFLSLYMNRSEAIDFIANISSQLSRNEEEIQVSLLGKLENL